MAEQSSPLLELIKEQGKVDDLQYEEVIAEHGRTGKPVNQILQDFGILDIDSILQIEADYLGTEVVSLRDKEFTPDLIRAIPSSTARMYQCVPVAVHDNSVQVAFVEPLIPGRSDELGFAIRKDIVPVVADPAQIEKTIERYYGEDTETLDPAGHVTSTEGSWRAGKNGARPGVFMPAKPNAGQAGQQEFYAGHAEDHFQILDNAASVKVPALTSKSALLTKEWTPLEPGVVDHKYYVRGIGTVLEQAIKGDTEVNRLISIKSAP